MALLYFYIINKGLYDPEILKLSSIYDNSKRKIFLTLAVTFKDGTSKRIAVAPLTSDVQLKRKAGYRCEKVY